MSTNIAIGRDPVQIAVNTNAAATATMINAWAQAGNPLVQRMDLDGSDPYDPPTYTEGATRTFIYIDYEEGTDSTSRGLIPQQPLKTINYAVTNFGGTYPTANPVVFVMAPTAHPVDEDIVLQPGQYIQGWGTYRRSTSVGGCSLFATDSFAAASNYPGALITNRGWHTAGAWGSSDYAMNNVVRNILLDCRGIANHGVATYSMGEGSKIEHVSVRNALLSGILSTGLNAPFTASDIEIYDSVGYGLEITKHPLVDISMGPHFIRGIAGNRNIRGGIGVGGNAYVEVSGYKMEDHNTAVTVAGDDADVIGQNAPMVVISGWNNRDTSKENVRDITFSDVVSGNLTYNDTTGQMTVTSLSVDNVAFLNQESSQAVLFSGTTGWDTIPKPWKTHGTPPNDDKYERPMWADQNTWYDLVSASGTTAVFQISRMPETPPANEVGVAFKMTAEGTVFRIMKTVDLWGNANGNTTGPYPIFNNSVKATGTTHMLEVDNTKDSGSADSPTITRKYRVPNHNTDDGSYAGRLAGIHIRGDIILNGRMLMQEGWELMARHPAVGELQPVMKQEADFTLGLYGMGGAGVKARTNRSEYSDSSILTDAHIKQQRVWVPTELRVGGDSADDGTPDIEIDGPNQRIEILDAGGTVMDQMIKGPREAAITDASGGATQDAEARTAINALLAAMRAHGLIET